MVKLQLYNSPGPITDLCKIEQLTTLQVVSSIEIL